MDNWCLPMNPTRLPTDQMRLPMDILRLPTGLLRQNSALVSQNWKMSVPFLDTVSARRGARLLPSRDFSVNRTVRI